MKKVYKDHLMNKRVFVSFGAVSAHPYEICYLLANTYAIKITRGAELVTEEILKEAADLLGEAVPEPFYRGFPESVQAMDSFLLFVDQICHYQRTYVEGDFSEPGHSIFETEEDVVRTVFREGYTIKEFSVVTEGEAIDLLAKDVADLLTATRPLSFHQYALVSGFLRDYDFKVERIASKNTCAKLLLDSRNLSLTRFLQMSDVIKLVDEMNYRIYGNDNIKKLNLNNHDRVFLTAVIDRLAEAGRIDLTNCYEKKKIWNGLLHHIHYKAKCEAGEEFVTAMRGKENHSVYSVVEADLARGDVKAAVDHLKEGKGAGALLRRLDYLLSRCESLEDMSYVLDHIESDNVIMLIQLMQKYDAQNQSGGPRTFKFTKYEKLRAHEETCDEVKRRKSAISEGQGKMIAKRIRENLERTLKNRLGKVYIDPEMRRYALPLQETTAQEGFGVLPKGTRIPIPEGKVLRGFTYWERVNDIDLSCFLLNESGEQLEFSWRTHAFNSQKEITYSGDETSGYDGGSEYFDVNLEKVKERYPEYRYMVFCDNVFSGTPFNRCFCKAGFMIRDKKTSGKVYEPKTVQSSFLVDCDSTFAYLFGIDFQTREFVWLNIARDSQLTVAGMSSMEFLLTYLRSALVFNLEDFFRLMSTETVETVEEADVVVTNKELQVPEGKELIREYDTARILALMNLRGKDPGTARKTEQ
jgi:stress response protein SCP2